MDYGTLRVTTPDGQVREYPINTTPVFIGRADSNRVVIDHVSVSRRHASLTIDGDQILIEDLGSASGTFVEAEQIPSETPRAILAGEALRFGDAQAVFIATATESVAASPVTPISPITPIVMSGQAPVSRPPVPTDQAVVVSLISPSAPIAAGATTNVTCIIENRGAEADRLAIEVQDLPEGWSRVTRPSLQLPPGGRDEVTIVLQPPHSPEARAGEHSFAVAATSQLRGVEVRALGRLTILPFGGHSLTLAPVRSTGAFNLMVTNGGNAPLSLALTGRDPEGALAVRVVPSAMDLEPGAQQPARVYARTAKGRFFGQERIFPFEVEAQGPIAKTTAAGELRSRPPWLLVRWFVLAGAVAAVAIGGFIGYQQVFGGDDAGKAGTEATATPKAQVTVDATPNPTGTSASVTPLPTRAPTATVVSGPTNLPTVTPPLPQSRLSSGSIGQAIGPVNLTAEPSGSARVLQSLKAGDRVIVVTNTPASGTFVVTEGLLFWRVVIEGTQTVGWVPEVTVAGDRRFLGLSR